MPSSFALYYPWLQFRDDNWLKLALLSWDNIARIRPRAVRDGDSELVRQLRAEAGLIVDITPTADDREAVAKAFYDIELRALVDPDDPRWWDLLVRPPGDVDPDRSELVWIFGGSPRGRDEGKTTFALRRQLVQLGLAIDDPHDDTQLGLRPKMASIYLAALADVVAQHNQLVPVTDDLRTHSAAGAVDNLASLLGGDLNPGRTITEGQHAYLHLAVRAVLQPDQLADVPPTTLIAFRQRYAAELTAFREHVATLAPELDKVAQVENLEVAQAHLQALYDTKTRPQLDELRKALRGMGVESSAGVVGVKVDMGPAAGTVLGSLAAPGGPVAIGSAALAVTVLPYLSSRYTAYRTLKRQSPVAYLLALDRHLGGRATLRRLRGRRRTQRL